MMPIQSRKRKLVSSFSSFLPNSFLLFSLHFPLNLNCQSTCKRKKSTHPEDPNSGASSPSTSPHGRDYEGEEDQRKRNNYEVFLSFRGKDTRKSFTDHLYHNLDCAGIRVFRDDEELHVGEEIGPELFRSITQSKISIPIISEDYASSKWCLHELAHMMKCKRSGGQIVLPIFYKVEPSQLRNPTGRLRNAINAHKKNLDKMIVKEWEETLQEVSILKGWVSDKIDEGYEGKLVQTVVSEVKSKLRRTYQLIVPEQFVGIDDPVEEIMSLIDPKFNETRIIGIYGMGGIGKTTLARVLYNNLSNHFEYLSFVANIRETSIRNGIEYLQKQLINDILRSPYTVSNVFEGIEVIKSRFTTKKVLILLDDMGDDTHLNALAGDSSWFKTGSIVIITTRNKTILDKARAGCMYQLNELPSDKSLILFSRHSFGKDSPPSDYEDISRAVISTTKGLPLALEVIGSLLCGKTTEVWEGTLKKLQSVPIQKVQETLKISYEALDDREKQIFLDIACFFIGESREKPTYMWDACGLYPEIGIEVLRNMSLIKIDEDGTLMMHDQLRDFGREIVCLENRMEPQQRSRLWMEEEAEYVLDGNKGTNKIESLRLDKIGRSYTAGQFKELNNMRFLSVRGANLTGDFQNLLPQLRWLEWKYCSSDFAAARFHPKRLVVLDLSYSEISKDWGGWDSLKNLEMLDISGTPVIKLLGDSGIMAELQELRAARWKSLEGPSSNTGELASLNKLDSDKKLSELRSRLLALVHLKHLRTPLANNSAMGYRTADSEHLLKRSRPFGISNEPSAITAFGSGNATVGESPGHRGAQVAAMLGMNSESMANVKPRVADKSEDKLQFWKLMEINEPSQCRSLRLPDNLTAMRVSRLIYKDSGCDILALTSNAVHKLWKWQKSDRNIIGSATTSVVPQLWQPPSGVSMTNDISDTNPEDALPCFALSKNSGYLMSASGGKVTVFICFSFERLTTFMPSPPAPTFLLENKNIIEIGMEDSSIQIYRGQFNEVKTKLKGHQRIIKGFAFSTSLNVLVSSGVDSQTMTTFMPPPPPATFLAFHPQDNNIVAIGMEDSSILIYQVQKDVVETELNGHQKRITGLAFSNVLNVLVSSSADSQLCVWSTDGWEKKASRLLQMPRGRRAAPLPHVQFHVDQIHLLVVHETQIATYEAPKLECLQQWVTREASGPITDATYSCNGQSIYVSFEDGSVGVLTASTLRLRCRINPTAYILSNPSLRVYPLVVAAHPSKPSQFALGLTDGSVYVLEPLESEGKWATSTPVENGDGPSTASGATGSDQLPSPTTGEAGLPQTWARRLRPRLLRPPRSPQCDLGTATVLKETKKTRRRKYNSAKSRF